jgi:SAM-dependent methyltransferase
MPTNNSSAPTADIGPADKKWELRALYGIRDFKPRAWTDASDLAFIGITLLERSIALLAPELTGELLDVGCGRQPYADYFRHVARKQTCDFNAARGQVDFECPAHKIPLPDNSLDSILCTEVLEHVPDPLAVWREFHRLLRPGGKVLLATPMSWPGHEEPYDFYRYPEFGLRYLARESGFEILRLVPRGGPWALLGQVGLHVMPHFIRFGWQRRMWNRFFLGLDGRRCSARLTMGWTLLALRLP